MKRGQILLDGEKAEGSRWVLPKQKISLLEDESTLPAVFELPLKVVFEDDFLAIVVKPLGFPVS